MQPIFFGTGTVSNIIDEWKKGVQDSDYESIRELSVFCKKQGVTLNALASCIRPNNYIQSLDANANESTLELLIANLANYPDRDPAKLFDAAQISESGIPLEKLEEHVKALLTEKETLQRAIDEGRAILDGADKDVESRTKLLEEYAQMKAEMRRYEIEPEDSKRFSNVLQVLQRDNYAKILETFADVDDVIKLRLEVDNAWGTLKTRLEEVKRVQDSKLPNARI